MIKSRIYCFKQRFFFARLVQKSHRTGRERSRPRVVVCVRCDENDRNPRIRRPQLTLKIKSTHAGIRTSRSKQSVWCNSFEFRNSAAEEKPCVRIPTDRNKLLSEFLRKSSSSTIEMSGAGGME